MAEGLRCAGRAFSAGLGEGEGPRGANVKGHTVVDLGSLKGFMCSFLLDWDWGLGSWDL